MEDNLLIKVGVSLERENKHIKNEEPKLLKFIYVITLLWNFGYTLIY